MQSTIKTDSVIEASKVTKVFRDFWLREKVTAVDQLDLSIRPREVFGLLGPNGSGKSTTIKMILGLLFPSKGRITVFGKLPTDVRVKSRIGFLPEESYLYPFLDARETLDFYGRLFQQNSRERRRRVDMLLDMVGLSSVAYRRVGEYSKGMQRRIGLAQALINDPDLLILDEPTSGMDPIGTKEFKDLIRTLASRGKTILLSSHLLADVEDVCDRVCILYGGKRRAIGDVDDLLTGKGSMQLTTDELDSQTLDQIRTVIANSGRQLHDVSLPRVRLEELFLRIVKEAQDQKIETGGAIAGGEVAQFLRENPQDGKSVIEQLVQPVQPAQPQVAKPQPKPQQPAAEMLKELVQPTEPAHAEQNSQLASPKPSKGSASADRSVLDSLINKARDGEA